MPAKKAAAKKRNSSKKRVAKSVASKPAARRAGSSTRRTPKASSKKTVKSVKSQSKVTKKEQPAHKGVQKVSAKKANGHSSKKVAPRPPPSAAPVTRAVAPPPRRRSSGSVLSGPMRFEPYMPKRGEDYMSKDQLEHFRQILLAWKRELMEEVDRTMLHMKDDAANFPDPNDRATQESEFGLELRTRDRERKLLKKIDSALGRIDDGSYGYCEETGDEIGLRRLEARPVATLCVEAQERRELAEKQFRDREDQYR
jgi:DnaK suppressor protein